jgi:hypothetical protein
VALDIESSQFSWDTLISLHHTEHTSNNGSRQINLDELHQICQEFGIVELEGMIREIDQEISICPSKKILLALLSNSCHR